MNNKEIVKQLMLKGLNDVTLDMINGSYERWITPILQRADIRNYYMYGKENSDPNNIYSFENTMRDGIKNYKRDNMENFIEEENAQPQWRINKIREEFNI